MATSSTLTESQKEIEIDGVRAQVMTRMQAIDKYGLGACANRVSTAFTNCYWIKGELIELVEESY